ncbi:hypothetical protein F5Y10DRAFT_276545 [Nemania abortiva]|nr:hypothetical protein F5Y10DRAFT_276545 [Nemania abortiva]
MSGTGITPNRRAVGWNVQFTIGRNTKPQAFAGIYQVPDSDLVTFRDVCDELCLCFEFPDDSAREGKCDNGHSDNPWASTAFALTDPPDLPSSEVRGLSFVIGNLLDRPVPSLQPISSKEQNVIKYHLVLHKACNLPCSSPLDTHLKRCARHLSEPIRRYDPRYLPPNEVPSDPKLSMMPFRQTLTAGSAKRSSSGSIPPAKQSLDNSEDTGFDNMLAPKDVEIDRDAAKRRVDYFRSSCLDSADHCAVTGLGKPWCTGFPIGPAIQACHIIPQIHYHLYPSGEDDDEDIATVYDSPRKLLLAWHNTWDPKNGILLKNDLHECFNAGLFSIHPHTLRIRVFVPYDVLTPFNGKKASVPSSTDWRALQHHYEMCCIENMAAKKPYSLTISPSVTRRALGSGTSSALSPRTDLPPTPEQIDPTQRLSPLSPQERKIRQSGPVIVLPVKK